MTQPTSSIHMLFICIAILCMPLGASAAELEWHDSSGALHSLKEYDGQPLMLHFWATWCPPCRAELPELAIWRSTHPEAVIIPISLDENPSTVVQFLKQNGLDLPANIGTNQQAIQLGVRGLPSSFLVAGNGKITRRFLGAQAWTDPAFSRKILRALKKASPQNAKH